ncbi:MAG: efflux RND transporter permease subunit [Butyrivibrio crossotus]|jgi:predicted RND superfamily exporter protein|nr:efflux RND transporter permease subunit [Butyrivibrio crossotus]
MKKFGKLIVKLRIPILILSVLLLIPAAIGYFNTKVNYDILYYLPGDIDTMKGQDILLDDFGKGAYAMVVVDGMNKKNVSELVKKVEKVDHVASVISYNGIVGDGVPAEILPDKFRSYFENDDSGATLFAIFFDDTTSSTETMDAIEELRDVTDKQCYIAGMSAVVTDTKSMSEKETPIYVLVAVLLVCVVLAIFMDSFLVPVLFMVSIGMAIVYNLGTNIFLGEVSYITKALAAVLQLGVTLDYSIFLWHSYKEEKEKNSGDHKEAMAVAIGNTLTSVVGSSITTVAGFIALCFMSFTLGLDLGIVMAKGVIFGVIGCVTILPSLILTFDKALEKTMHKEIMPNFDKPARWIVKHSWLFLIVFLGLLYPAIYGYNHTKVYYDLSDTLPDKLNCSQANKLLAENFDKTNSIYMILADTNLSKDDSIAMIDEIKKLDGISTAMSLDSVVGAELPTEMLPDSLVSELKGNEYQIMMISTNYAIASDEINDQIDKVDEIAKKYDAKSMVIGEAPCTKDLITITDKDFKTVSIVSIAAIFVIIFVVLKSISLPVILVAAIEFAIFVNMGIPYFTGTSIPFISSVVIGTIQLGATVDYAILMTTRYKRERAAGESKKEAISIALGTSIPSIIVSALGFFAATFGVGMIASVDMISSLCILMARGAIISMLVVIFILPSLFVLFDKLIINTSIGFKSKKNKKEAVM